jgi:Tfp pilus assembly protein PilW
MLTTARLQRGFNIVELMVALTLGLLVSIAVISFVVSTIQSTNAAMQATRLNQELRSLAEVVAREIRRARATTDPLANVGSGCDRNASTPATTDDCSGLDVMRSLDMSTAGCIRFGYQGGTGGNFRAIRRNVVGGVGSVLLSRGTRADTECTDPGTTISSDIIDVTALTFEGAITDPGPPVVRSNNGINLTLSGRLRNGPAGVQFEKTYQTTVFIRSGGF